jgi:hypothetical protein
MQNMDAVANVIVLVAAGVGAVVAIVCVLQLVRHHGGRDPASSRLTSSGRG